MTTAPTTDPPVTEWIARMITPSAELDAAPLFRCQFTLDEDHGPVTTATLRISAFGVFEATLNGHPVDDDVLSPGWTSYNQRLRYRTYDVTNLLDQTTVLGVSVGNGWYRGRLGWDGRRALYGDQLAVIAELEIGFDDGHRQLVTSDDTWTAGPSGVLADDLYDGQTIDARRHDSNWQHPGATPATWGPVTPLEFDIGRLTPYVGPPVRRQEIRRPERIWTSPAGATLIDFGQNLVGWIRCHVRGTAGDEITVRHAEVLEHDELGVRPLRTAQATDRFICSGDDDTFEPTFTFHGFRYAEITGWPGEIIADSIEAVVVHSDIRRTGWFECSDELVNQLHRNVVWGLRSNFVDVPSDCPQRDERLGYTGDLAAFAPTAAFLYDVDDFLRDWLLDLSVEQSLKDGLVPMIVPDVLSGTGGALEAMMDATAVWGDAAVWVPWAMWEAYGDISVLRTQYHSMAAHLRRICDHGMDDEGLWTKTFQLGDWLDPDAPPDQPWQAKADPLVVATACLYRDAVILASTARLLDQLSDAEEFDALAQRTRAAFLRHYVGADGIIRSDAPTVYSLAIVFGLLDEEGKRRAGERLATLVRERGHHVSTGFAGTPFICHALTMTGHVDDAYSMLLQRTCPSWLYPVTMGATTVWERWDSMLPDGTINPGEMTSFNHYAFGAIADWLHRTVAGLAPLEPGYSRVHVAPRPDPRLEWASTALDTRHGRIEVSWRSEGNTVTVDVSLPPGVTGLLDLPGQPLMELDSGQHRHVKNL